MVDDISFLSERFWDGLLNIEVAFCFDGTQYKANLISDLNEGYAIKLPQSLDVPSVTAKEILKEIIRAYRIS